MLGALTLFQIKRSWATDFHEMGPVVEVRDKYQAGITDFSVCSGCITLFPLLCSISVGNSSPRYGHCQDRLPVFDPLRLITSRAAVSPLTDGFAISYGLSLHKSFNPTVRQRELTA